MYVHSFRKFAPLLFGAAELPNPHVYGTRLDPNTTLVSH